MRNLSKQEKERYQFLKNLYCEKRAQIEINEIEPESEFDENDELYGPNPITVYEARENYKKYGFADMEFLKAMLKDKDYEPLPITKLLTKDSNI